MGVAKYLDRTQTTVTPAQFLERLPLTLTSLQAGLKALQEGGFDMELLSENPQICHLKHVRNPSADYAQALQDFLEIVQEEQFRRRYFARVPVSNLSTGIDQDS